MSAGIDLLGKRVERRRHLDRVAGPRLEPAQPRRQGGQVPRRPGA